MSKKKLDVLTQKRKDLGTYVQMADTAISLVTSTIDTLKSINANIKSEIEEIEDYQKELNSTKDELNDAMTKNDKVIGNFNALLGVE